MEGWKSGRLALSEVEGMEEWKGGRLALSEVEGMEEWKGELRNPQSEMGRVGGCSLLIVHC
jgi:hypothetical protein